MQVSILGAFDRHNYGDLLFPLILKDYFSKIEKKIELNYYGLTKANLSQYGGIDTLPFAEFYSQSKLLSSKNVIIVAGGSVVGTRAGILYSFLKQRRILDFFRKSSKVFFRSDFTESIAKKQLKITWGNYPFCPRKPSEKTLLIYNSVGDKFREDVELIEVLKSADYISVRNPNLYTKLKTHIFDQDRILLCPDSASVMADIWHREILKDKATHESKRILSNYKEGYIAFQGKIKMKWHIRDITKQLRKLYDMTKLPILLVSIGRAYKHEDHIFLNQLANKLDVPVKLLNSENIFDIMYAISCAKLFIGTSLHGNITAMSYAVPHLGFSKVLKLDQYLKHWDVGPNQSTGCIKSSQICDASVNLLQKIDHEQLVDNSKRLSMLADKNLKTIIEYVNRYKGGSG